MVAYFNLSKAPPVGRKCVCGADACKKLSVDFRRICELRGGYTQFPTLPKPEDNRTSLVEKQTGLVNAYKLALSISSSQNTCMSVDPRNRKKQASQGVITRQQSTVKSSSDKKRSLKYIALHHFHPEILKLWYVKEDKRMRSRDRPMTVAPEFVKKSLGGELAGWRNAYKDRTGNYYIVPLYTIAQAQADLVKVTAYWRNAKETSHLAGDEAPMTAPKIEVPTPIEQVVVTRAAQVVVSSAESSIPSQGTGGGTKRSSETSSVLAPTSAKVQRVLTHAIGLARGYQSEVRALGVAAASHQATVDERYEFATGRDGGLNRLSVQSKRSFRLFPGRCKALYGFANFREVVKWIYAGFDLRPSKELTSDLFGATLSQFEQCLIGLMFIESGMNQQMIASVFGVGNSLISEICILWVPQWGRLGRHLSVLPFIDETTIDALETEKFNTLKISKVAYINDGKDFKTETSRQDRVINNAQQSTKVNHSAFRVVSWGLPCGLTFEHTCGFLARVVEKKLVKVWAENGRLILPIGYIGVSDKGFHGTAGYYKHCNTVVCPAFLWKGIQFDKNQVGHSLAVSQGRYSIETFYSRVADRKCFAGKILSRSMFSYFDSLNHWAHGRANLYLPLQMPMKYKKK